MITIDCFQTNIQIKDPESLTPLSVISQLQFWGFRRIEGQPLFVMSSDKPEPVLVKVTSYLGKQGIPYETTPVVEQLLEDERLRAQKYREIAHASHLFKLNRFDINRFNAFIEFARSALVRNLRDHQLKAAFHLLLVENGANFSVPGSGKTSVVLAVYEKLRRDSVVNCLYVVGPPSCFGPWRIEFQETLGRKPKYAILAGSDQNIRRTQYFKSPDERPELFLTTYHTLLNDQKDVSTFLSQVTCDAFLVIDEAHYMKQLGGEWATALLCMAPLARIRVVLTGTPIPRSYTDVFNLFDFIWPSNPPLTSAQKIQIELAEQRNDTQSVLSIFEDTIEPLMYRVRKSDLGLLPAHFHPPIQICMNQYERRLYDAVVRRIRLWASEDYLKNIDLVRRLRRGRMIRVRQCLSYCAMLRSGIEHYDESFCSDESYLANIINQYDGLEIPAKIACLKDLVRELLNDGLKVLIWAHFRDTLNLIRRSVQEMGYRCDMIYGDTPTQNTSLSEERTRELIRDEFVNPNSGLDVLIANPAACAESISLHKTCYHAVYYDLSYNCAQYLQSLDRIHRIGGSEHNEANYYFLQYADTVESNIKANLDRKAQRMYEVVEKDFPVYSLNMFGEDDEEEVYKRIFGDAE